MIDKVKFFTSNLFCTFFYIGYIKFMPGTFGSFAGLLLGVSLKNYFELYILIIFTLLIFVISIFAIRIFQLKKGKKDRSEIIIDEIIGQQIPIILFEMYLLNIILSFIFFRFFDILKIYPAGYIDKKYSNSFGIIADDIVAGFQASLLIYLIILIK